jgi:hypothetical protein
MKKLFLFFALLLFSLNALAGVQINSLTIPQPVFKNASTTITASTTNTLLEAQNINVKLYDNGILKFAMQDLFDANQIKNYSIIWTPEMLGTHNIDFNATAADGNSAATSQSVEVIQYSEVDLILDNNSISIDENIVLNKSFTGRVTISNKGSVDANRALIRVYHGVESLTNIIYSAYLTIPKQSQGLISFSYTPKVTGMDLIIAKIDPENELVESNEMNNRAEKIFEVKPAEESGVVPSPLQLTLQSQQKECVIILSNNDKFFFTEIALDENTQDYYVKFSFTDVFGTELLSTKGFAGNEFLLPSRTVRIVSVSGLIGYIIIAFSYPVSIITSTCQADVSDIIGKLNSCKIQVEDLEKEAGNFKACSVEKEGCLQQLGATKTSLIERESTLSGCESRMIAFSADCSNRVASDVNMAVAYEQTKANIILNESAIRLENSEETGNVLFAICLCLWIAVIAIGIYHVWFRRKMVGGL